jgi:release factor glutamine methyltransferase
MKKLPFTYFMALSEARSMLGKIIRNKDSAFREAEAIFLHAAGVAREKLYTHYRDPLPRQLYSKFMKLIRLRLTHMPLQYITGSECFYGREFKVEKGVFIPRPDTEAIIDAVKLLKNSLPSGAIAADCGSGSGIIPVTLLKELDNISRFYCFDRNPKAVKLTMSNAINHGVIRRVKALKSDFFTLCRRDHMKFDLLVSNPPYIRLKALKTLQKEVLKEPRMALTDGGRGYSFYEKFAKYGPKTLNKGGFLAVEIGDNMGKKVRKFFMSPTWKFECAYKDFRGKERVLVFRAM